MNPSLLIPGLCAVLMLTAFSFMFASSMAPVLLLLTSATLLVLSYAVHRSQFQSDYKESTWQDGLRPLAPFFLVGLVLTFAFGAWFIMDKSSSPASASANKPAAAPAAASPAA